jgi:peptidylprolyl isomerase
MCVFATPARRPASLLALGLVVALAACDDDLIGPVYPEDVEFAPELGVDLSQMTRLQSGVYIQTLEEGSGLGVDEGSDVFADYTLWLPSGTQVDSGQNARLTIAPGGVIEGFYLGMLGAREGETRLIVIPSELGYGEAGRPGIPGGAVLVFRVTVNEIELPEG